MVSLTLLSGAGSGRMRAFGAWRSLLATLAFLPASALAGATLGEALSRASALDPDIVALQARRAEVSASRSVAEGLFAGPAAVSAGLRRDRPDRDLGRNEIDVELGLPLWLPGQRDLRARLADREGDEHAAALAEARWRLAGRLRDAWARIEAARAEATAAERRAATLARIEQDTARRVAAGVLARADLLLAQAEVAAARASADTAALMVTAAEREWRGLTGMHEVPARLSEAPSTIASAGDATAVPGGPAHPARWGALSRVDLAMSRLAWASGSRRDPPELALGHRSDRAEYGVDYRNTVRVALRIPLASEARNAPRLAAASTAVARAQAEQFQIERRLELDRAQATAALEAVGRQFERASERLRAAWEHEVLVERAFALGEQPLVSRLRAAALREDAQADVDRAQVAISAARARLAQAIGELP